MVDAHLLVHNISLNVNRPLSVLYLLASLTTTAQANSY